MKFTVCLLLCLFRLFALCARPNPGMDLCPIWHYTGKEDSLRLGTNPITKVAHTHTHTHTSWGNR